MKSSKPGFTLIELLVVIGIIGVLLGILLPALESVRHKSYITKCASNLHQIGVGITMYENDNAGNYPRTMYNPAAPLTAGTGVSAIDPFTAGGPAANDLTSPLFLLMKSQKLPPTMFICPYNDDTSYVADSSNLQGRSNFTDYRKNLSFSFANPYPNAAAAIAGYRLTNKLGSDFPLAADLNPGVGQRSNVFAALEGAPPSMMNKANSDNHEQDGQNVLFADGHVTWNTTPLCGIGHDNIYTSKSATSPNVEASPADPADSVLLPDGD
jgi:prepilin-type N-terminal cleavage/methylation domain-containing protein/prepilin-type processing-associated H-X9-DG protein